MNMMMMMTSLASLFRPLECPKMFANHNHFRLQQPNAPSFFLPFSLSSYKRTNACNQPANEDTNQPLSSSDITYCEVIPNMAEICAKMRSSVLKCLPACLPACCSQIWSLSMHGLWKGSPSASLSVSQLANQPTNPLAHNSTSRWLSCECIWTVIWPVWCLSIHLSGWIRNIQTKGGHDEKQFWSVCRALLAGNPSHRQAKISLYWIRLWGPLCLKEQQQGSYLTPVVNQLIVKQNFEFL